MNKKKIWRVSTEISKLNSEQKLQLVAEMLCTLNRSLGAKEKTIYEMIRNYNNKYNKR